MFDFSERIRQKLQVAQLLKLRQSSFVFFAGAVLVIVSSVGFFIVPKYFEVQRVKAEITETRDSIDDIELKVNEKEDNLTAAEEELSHYEEKYKPRLDKVLPNTEQLSELTRFLEKFALDLEKKGTMELSTISYGGSKNVGEYSILPVRLSFRANDVNFVHFMEMVNKSGSIEEEDFYDGEAVRLMRVDQISVSIPPFNTSQTEEALYTVNLQLSAFYQNPKTSKKTHAKKKK